MNGLIGKTQFMASNPHDFASQFNFSSFNQKSSYYPGEYERNDMLDLQETHDAS